MWLSLSQDKEVFKSILRAFLIESKTSGLLASLVSQAEKHTCPRRGKRCRHEVRAHTQAVGKLSEAAKTSGTPNSRMVTRPAVGGCALRASPVSHESRECAREALERGKDGPSRLGVMSGSFCTATRW